MIWFKSSFVANLIVFTCLLLIFVILSIYWFMVGSKTLGLLFSFLAGVLLLQLLVGDKLLELVTNYLSK